MEAATVRDHGSTLQISCSAPWYHFTSEAAILKAPAYYLWKLCWQDQGTIRGQSQMESLQQTHEGFHSLIAPCLLTALYGCWKPRPSQSCLRSEWSHLLTACHTSPLYCPHTTADCSPWVPHPTDVFHWGSSDRTGVSTQPCLCLLGSAGDSNLISSRLCLSERYIVTLRSEKSGREERQFHTQPSTCCNLSNTPFSAVFINLQLCPLPWYTFSWCSIATLQAEWNISESINTQRSEDNGHSK